MLLSCDDERGCNVVDAKFDVELAADGRLETLEILVVLVFGWFEPAGPASVRRGGGISALSLPPETGPPHGGTKPPAAATAVASRASWPTHQSHRSHPITVAKVPHPTTETGLRRSWKMPTKQTTKMMTEQTCWTMTVESATNGQKS